MSHEMNLAGPDSGAYVEDLSTSQVLFSERAQTLHPPASVEKLYTATVALQLLGSEARLQTSVLGTGQMGPEGVWEGNLYLRGGGDPTFGSSSFIGSHYEGLGASVQTLARELAVKEGIKRVTGRIEGDESYFDSRRGEPASGYAPDPYLEGSLSALAFNRGESGKAKGPHAPAAWAAHELRAALQAYHVQVQRGTGAARTPPGARELVAVQSPTVAQLLGLMLPPSDNFFAETLLKDLGARFGGAGTTQAGAAVVRRTISKLGIDPQIVDGSGLSREDETSPDQVVHLLSYLSNSANGRLLRSDLAVAGKTGTLSERMRHTGAAGRCEGKTGTLIGVSNLAGYCLARNGDLLAFAFFDDNLNLEAAHTLQDNMAITLANY
jgi:D-alanyl-D-alanine carboxypeptidase/D-alanyl-D-alanine-endopeptidase (penicillin-binding protein 4)